MNNKNESEEVPILLMFLENSKVAELIRLMFNRKMSEQYLQKYGDACESKIKKSQQSKMQDYLRRFSIKEIMTLKGSQKGNVKYYCNIFIETFLDRKLRLNYKFTNSDRKIAWVQLTEYFQLQNLYEGLNELELPQEIKNVINKDIYRTYLSPELHQFTENSQKMKLQSIMRQRLFEILQKIAKYNPYIGYCQGMNTIILFFIEENFTNQQIFFIFKKISEEILPCDYYSSMDSAVTFVRILFEILHYTHPNIAKKMKNIIKLMNGDGFMLTMSFVFQWFICLFTNTNLSRSIRLRIMDYFLIEGVTVLFTAALAYFDVLNKVIQSVSCFEEYLPLAQKVMKQFNDEQILNNRLNNTYINKKILLLLKQKLILPSESRRQRQSKSNCNPRWNTCLQYIENNIAEGSRSQFFVFKINEEVKIIDNYLDKFHKQYFKISNTKFKSDQLRLGRMGHVCRQGSMTSRTYDDENQSKQSFISLGESQLLKNQSKKSPIKKSSQNTKKNQQQKTKKELIRSKAMKNLEKAFNSDRKSFMNRSESVQFMKNMIQNQSFSNLLEILEVNQMDNLFKGVIEDQQDD